MRRDELTLDDFSLKLEDLLSSAAELTDVSGQQVGVIVLTFDLTVARFNPSTLIFRRSLSLFSRIIAWSVHNTSLYCVSCLNLKAFC